MPSQKVFNKMLHVPKAAELLAIQSKKNRGNDHQNEPSSADNLPAQIPG